MNAPNFSYTEGTPQGYRDELARLGYAVTPEHEAEHKELSEEGDGVCDACNDLIAMFREGE